MDTVSSLFASYRSTTNSHRRSHYRTVSERLSADRDTRALNNYAKQEKKWSSICCAAVKRSEQYRAKVELAELLEQASKKASPSGEYVWYHSLRGDSRRAMNLRDTGLFYFVDINAINKRGITLRRSPALSESSLMTRGNSQDKYLEDREFLLHKALTQVMPGVLPVTDDLLVEGRSIAHKE